MNADTKGEGTILELDRGLDAADADVEALMHALLQALRAWMHEGRTVVITRDDRTREVRIDTYDPTGPDPATSLVEEPFENLGPCEHDEDEGRACPGPGGSTSRQRGTLRSDRRRR